MQLLSALECYSTHPPKQFLIVRGWFGDFDASLSFCPVRSTNALLETNLDCMCDGVIVCQKFQTNSGYMWHC